MNDGKRVKLFCLSLCLLSVAFSAAYLWEDTPDSLPVYTDSIKQSVDSTEQSANSTEQSANSVSTPSVSKGDGETELSSVENVSRETISRLQLQSSNGNDSAASSSSPPVSSRQSSSKLPVSSREERPLSPYEEGLLSKDTVTSEGRPSSSQDTVTSEEQSSSSHESDYSTPESKPDSSTPSFPPFESEQSSRPESDDTGDKENDKLARTLSAKYQITVLIARGETDYSSPEIAGYASNAQTVAEGLNEVSMTLSQLPNQTFEEISLPKLLVLVSETTAGDIVNTGDALLLPCLNGLHGTALLEVLLDLIAEQLAAEVTPDFTAYNPSGFYYGDPQSKYIYSRTNQLSGWFISAAAQQDAAADLCASFYAIFQQRSLMLAIPTQSPYYKKLRYTCGLLVDWADCLRENAVIKRFVA